MLFKQKKKGILAKQANKSPSPPDNRVKCVNLSAVELDSFILGNSSWRNSLNPTVHVLGWCGDFESDSQENIKLQILTLHLSSLAFHTYLMVTWDWMERNLLTCLNMWCEACIKSQNGTWHHSPPPFFFICFPQTACRDSSPEQHLHGLSWFWPASKGFFVWRSNPCPRCWNPSSGLIFASALFTVCAAKISLRWQNKFLSF